MECKEILSDGQSFCNNVPTALLREKIREYSKQQREKLRENATDSLRFGLGEIQAKITELDNLNEKDVSGLAARIKRRKHATVEDMYRLCHAFLQSIENIRVFSKIPGAIQILVKEITSSDSERRIAAGECLCNLSLGEPPVCEKIASLSGSYLVTYLDTNEERLKRTSIWTLANILDSGGRSAQIIMHMELVPKLWHLYIASDLSADAYTCDDYRLDAAICLQIISEQSESLLRRQDFDYIKNNMITKNPTCVGGEYHLKIIFDCNIINPQDSNMLEEQDLKYLINFSLNNLIQYSPGLEHNAYRLRLLYAIRVLSNLIATQQKALDLLMFQISTVWRTNLVKLLNKLFDLHNEIVTKESLWFLKTLLNAENSLLSSETFLRRLQIPKINASVL